MKTTLEKHKHAAISTLLFAGLLCGLAVGVFAAGLVVALITNSWGFGFALLGIALVSWYILTYMDTENETNP